MDGIFSVFANVFACIDVWMCDTNTHIESENEKWNEVCGCWMCKVCIRDDQLFNLIIFDDIRTEIHKYPFKRTTTVWAVHIT